MRINMFRATHYPSSGAQNCTSSLWFCIRERLLDVEVAGRIQQPQHPTTSHVRKTRGCQCSFGFLLMMCGVSPETCWSSNKHGIINFDTLLHLVGYFCMKYPWCTDPWTSSSYILFMKQNFVSFFSVILEKTIRFPRSLSVKAASVLKGFLNKNPADRLGCHRETGFLDIVNHPFFKSIDWEMVSGNPFPFFVFLIQSYKCN